MSVLVPLLGSVLAFALAGLVMWVGSFILPAVLVMVAGVLTFFGVILLLARWSESR